MLLKRILLCSSVLLFIFLGMKSVKYNSSEYIVNEVWKHYDGFHAGDLIKFEVDNNKELIMLGGVRKASVVFCFNQRLIIKSSETGKLGFYIMKKGFRVGKK